MEFKIIKKVKKIIDNYKLKRNQRINRKQLDKLIQAKNRSKSELDDFNEAITLNNF